MRCSVEAVLRVPFWLGVVLAPWSAQAGAPSVDALFPEVEVARAAEPAERTVRSAFDALFGFEGVVHVESVERGSDGRSEHLRFRLYRKRFEGGMRVMLATLEPAAVRGRRVLEVEDGSARGRAWIFAPQVDARPIDTDYRITDPFLGTLSDRAPSEVRANLSGLARGYEIIARRFVRRETAVLQQIGLRPLAARQFESVELSIDLERPWILEYRYFERGDSQPARVVLVPRDALLEFEGRMLPGRMLYRDRIQNTETALTLRYEPLPESDTELLFLQSTFYRVRIAD